MERKLEIGQKYKHFKGNIYEIICLARDSESLKEVVVYGHENDIWVRDVSEFLSLVDKDKYPDVKQKYRFELVDDVCKKV